MDGLHTYVSKTVLSIWDTYSFESFPGLYRNQSTFPWPRFQSSPRTDANSASVRPGASLLITTFNFGDGGFEMTARGPFPEVWEAVIARTPFMLPRLPPGVVGVAISCDLAAKERKAEASCEEKHASEIFLPRQRRSQSHSWFSLH